MPKLSVYQHELLEKKREKARRLYKQGFTTREVGNMVGKSRTWVWEAIKKLSTEIKNDKA
jgi:DNA invertase Pin-like site-specific DNA recombinase